MNHMYDYQTERCVMCGIGRDALEDGDCKGGLKYTEILHVGNRGPIWERKPYSPHVDNHQVK